MAVQHKTSDELIQAHYEDRFSDLKPELRRVAASLARTLDEKWGG
jgi:hypothetical protein